jgi:hypothetical protein
MTTTNDWRTILASALDWREAHATLDDAADPATFPLPLRNLRPTNFPHSGWELLEHIRLTQADLADFLENSKYSAPNWPADYWPRASSDAPPTDDVWNASLDAIHRDTHRIRRLALDSAVDLTARIPWGDGQTYLRTILLAVDHTSYHVGQLVAVRRILGAWKPDQ